MFFGKNVRHVYSLYSSYTSAMLEVYWDIEHCSWHTPCAYETHKIRVLVCCKRCWNDIHEGVYSTKRLRPIEVCV